MAELIPCQICGGLGHCATDHRATDIQSVERGKWVKHINHRYDYDREQGDILAGVSYTCSLCSFHGYPNWHYCPNCGTQMSTE